MNKIKITEDVRLVLAFILISQLFFLNGFYLLVCMSCFYIGVYFLQQSYKPSVFTIIFLYHFLQIIGGVWLANSLQNDINYRSESMGIATLVSLAGLLIMFAPIIYFQNKIPEITLTTFKKHADRLSINKTFYAYVIAFFVTGSLNGIRWLLPGYTQFILSIVLLKWFFFLLFGFQSILKNKRRTELYLFILVEFISGFYSFFSDFKTVLFFSAAIYLTLLTNLTVKKILVGGVIVCIIFFAATFWTTVKIQYRIFLNKGEVSQNVEVSRNEALAKLYDLSTQQTGGISSSATSKFLDRLQATYPFAKTMDRVPSIIPYQNGNNWGETFSFIFTPRLFNPDKPVLDASIKASKYTGIQYANINSGASFSLGYFAECYLDFGIYGMIPALLIIGFLYGFTYFYFLRNLSSNYIFNYAAVCALYMRFSAFEMDSIFFIGGLITDLLMYFLLSKFFFPWLYRFLLEPKENLTVLS